MTDDLSYKDDSLIEDLKNKISELKNEHDALREQVEAAREALSTLLVHIPNGTALDRYKHEGYAALARLDLQETD